MDNETIQKTFERLKLSIEAAEQLVYFHKHKAEDLRRWTGYERFMNTHHNIGSLGRAVQLTQEGIERRERELQCEIDAIESELEKLQKLK